MLKANIVLLSLILLGSMHNARSAQPQLDETDETTAKNIALIEGVLASPLSGYSSYELTHKDDLDATIVSTLFAFLRTAHGVAFQVNHQRTYLGLKIIMGLLAAYDAGTFVQRYRQLACYRAPENKPSTQPTKLAAPKPAPTTEKATSKTNEKVSPYYDMRKNIFSTTIHSLAHQVELAAALILAMSSSHKTSALRCEYAACFALLAARAVTIAEQHPSWFTRLALLIMLSLMALDFTLPNSPFNTFAAEREKEFEAYIDLQAEIGSCMKQLNQMQAIVEKALSGQINRSQHAWLSSMAAAVEQNRATLRATMCATDISLNEAEGILTDAQIFYDQKIAAVTNAYQNVIRPD